ncbi:hypothetical protein OH77DRAFT_522150, partial [Trametes cingulata]
MQAAQVGSTRLPFGRTPRTSWTHLPSCAVSLRQIRAFSGCVLAVRSGRRLSPACYADSEINPLVPRRSPSTCSFWGARSIDRFLSVFARLTGFRSAYRPRSTRPVRDTIDPFVIRPNPKQVRRQSRWHRILT